MINEHTRDDLLNFIREHQTNITDIQSVNTYNYNEGNSSSPFKNNSINRHYNMGLSGGFFLITYTGMNQTAAASGQVLVNKNQFSLWREKQYAITWL